MQEEDKESDDKVEILEVRQLLPPLGSMVKQELEERSEEPFRTQEVTIYLLNTPEREAWEAANAEKLFPLNGEKKVDETMDDVIHTEDNQ